MPAFAEELTSIPSEETELLDDGQASESYDLFKTADDLLLSSETDSLTVTGEEELLLASGNTEDLLSASEPQPAGEVLTSSAVPAANTTSLPDGEYGPDQVSLVYTGGTGKVTWAVDRLIVSGGKAAAVLRTSSTSTSRFYLGATAEMTEEEQAALKEAGTDKGVYTVTVRKDEEPKGSYALVPVPVNTEFPVAALTTAMSKEHWVDYTISINIQENTPLTVTNNVKMLKVSAATLKSNGADQELLLAMGSTAYDLLFVGRADAAVKEAAAALTEDGTFSFPVPALGKAFVVSMHSAKNDSWYEREVTVNKGEKTLLLDYVTNLTPLEITNTTGMFKAAAAFLKEYNGTYSLLVSLTGKSYHYLFRGNYEEAAANGDNRARWIPYTLNDEELYTFEIPLAEGESYIPVVSISNSYLTKYENGEVPLERAFYPRQFILNAEEGKLSVGDYEETVEMSVISNVETFKPAAKAAMTVIGGPNSNNYACIPTLSMTDETYNSARYRTCKDGADEQETVSLSADHTFTLRLQNGPNILVFEDKTPVSVFFQKASSGTWVEMQMTIDKAAGTILFDNMLGTYDISSPKGFVYNGGNIWPRVQFYYADGTECPKSEYTVTRPAASKNAGTYELSVSFPGRYDTFTIPYTIQKAATDIKISDMTRRVDSNSFQLPKKTLKGGAAVSYKIDNASVASVSSAGKVTIKGCGTARITASAPASKNFNEVTKTVTLTVKPRPTILDRIFDNGNGSWRAIVRQVEDVDNYHLLYADNPEFRNAKSLTIRTGIHSYTRYGFEKGKTYYIKARTSKIVDGTRIYSNWCGVKSVTLKK